MATEGITNHPLKEELASDKHLGERGGTPPAQGNPVPESEVEQTDGLPSGMAERVETVEQSTFKPGPSKTE